MRAIFALLALFFVPVSILAQEQEPRLWPGSAAIYVTQGTNPQEDMLVVEIVGFDGAQSTRWIQVPKGTQLKPNLVVCSLDKLEENILAVSKTSGATSRKNDVPTLVAEGPQRPEAKPVAATQLRPVPAPKLPDTRKTVVRPERTTEVAVIPPAVDLREVADATPPVTEPVQEETPATVLANETPAPDNGQRENETPAPATADEADANADATNERIEAMMTIIIVLLALVLLAVIGGTLVIVKMIRDNNRHNAEMLKGLHDNQKHINLHDLVHNAHEAMQQRLRQLEEGLLSRLHPHVTQPTTEPSRPQSGTTEQIHVPTLRDTPVPDYDGTGALPAMAETDSLVPTTTNANVPAVTGVVEVTAETSTTAAPVTETIDDSSLADRAFLDHCLAALFVTRPLVEEFIKEAHIELGSHATRGDVKELVAAFDDDGLNSLFFAGLRQLVIGHERTTFVAGDHNEFLALKTGMKSWAVRSKLEQRMKMGSAATTPNDDEALKEDLNDAHRRAYTS